VELVLDPREGGAEARGPLLRATLGQDVGEGLAEVLALLTFDRRTAEERAAQVAVVDGDDRLGQVLDERGVARLAGPQALLGALAGGDVLDLSGHVHRPPLGVADDRAVQLDPDRLAGDRHVALAVPQHVDVAGHEPVEIGGVGAAIVRVGELVEAAADELIGGQPDEVRERAVGSHHRAVERGDDETGGAVLERAPEQLLALAGALVGRTGLLAVGVVVGPGHHVDHARNEDRERREDRDARQESGSREQEKQGERKGPARQRTRAYGHAEFIGHRGERARPLRCRLTRRVPVLIPRRYVQRPESRVQSAKAALCTLHSALPKRGAAGHKARPPAQLRCALPRLRRWRWPAR
jgi:hypothetical protein